MEVLEQMRMLLREKAILFGQYEQETLRLDTDDLDAVDDIVDAVQARQALIDKINGLDRRIAAIGEASAYGARCFHIGKISAIMPALLRMSRQYSGSGRRYLPS